MKNPDHTSNLTALKRIEGQVRGVQGMITDNQYCIDILNQLYAIKGALARVEEKILKQHFEHCLTGAMRGQSEKEQQQKLNELLTLIHRVRK